MTGVTKTAFREVISDSVKNRLSNALQTTAEDDDKMEALETPEDEDTIVTTEEEREAFMIIRAIVCAVVPAERVFMRDAKSYCAILIDDNNRRPLARLHFNKKNKQIGLFDNSADEKVNIDHLDNIYDYADRLRETTKKYIDADK